VTIHDEAIQSWLRGLESRHRAGLTNAEFFKAVRALSARYVERRAELPGRSPLDSAGKRAAFAAFYAPLHFFTMREVVNALGANAQPVRTILDLGCGTGVASAAWALGVAAPPSLRGIDRHPWAIQESQWTWQQLRLGGHATRTDMVDAPNQLLRQGQADAATAIVAGWSVNELPAPARERLLRHVIEAARIGVSVLVVEPLARAATPWWDQWVAAVRAAGGRSDRWKFDVTLPPSLAAIDEAAGFTREGLGAKTLWMSPALR